MAPVTRSQHNKPVGPQTKSHPSMVLRPKDTAHGIRKSRARPCSSSRIPKATKRHHTRKVLRPKKCSAKTQKRTSPSSGSSYTSNVSNSHIPSSPTSSLATTIETSTLPTPPPEKSGIKIRIPCVLEKIAAERYACREFSLFRQLLRSCEECIYRDNVVSLQCGFEILKLVRETVTVIHAGWPLPSEHHDEFKSFVAEVERFNKVLPGRREKFLELKKQRLECEVVDCDETMSDDTQSEKATTKFAIAKAE